MTKFSDQFKDVVGIKDSVTNLYFTSAGIMMEQNGKPIGNGIMGAAEWNALDDNVSILCPLNGSTEYNFDDTTKRRLDKYKRRFIHLCIMSSHTQAKEMDKFARSFGS